MGALEQILLDAEKPAFFEKQGKSRKKLFRRAISASAGALAVGAALTTLPGANLDSSIAAAVVGVGIGAAADSNLGLKKGFKEYLKKPVDYFNLLFEKPELFSIGFGAVNAAVLAGKAFSGNAFDETNFLAPQYYIGMWGAITATAAYAGLTLLGRALHTHSIRTIGARLKPTKESLESLITLPHSKEKEASLHIMLAGQELMHKDYWQASKQYIEALKSAASERRYSGIGDWLIPNARKAFGKAAIEDAMHSHIREGTKAFFQGKLNQADALFRDAIKASPERRLPHIAYSRFLKAAAQNEGHLDMANKELKVYESLLLQDSSARFLPVGESRNEILVAKSSLDVAEDLVFKRSPDKKELEREYQTIAFFRKLFGDNIANPVDFSSSGAYWQLVLETAYGETLFERVKSKRHTTDDFIQAAKLLARIQKAGVKAWEERKLSVDEVVEAGYYSGRLQKIFLEQVEANSDIRFSSDFKQLLADNAVPILDSLSSLETTFYKDANLKNWIKSSNLTAIDFEMPRLLPAQLDLVNLLKFQYDYLSNEQKKRVISAYIKESGNKSTLSEFLKYYEFAAFQRHLELIGYRSRDAKANPDNADENRAAMKFDFIKAREQLEEIIDKNYFSKEATQKLVQLRDSFVAEEIKFGNYALASRIKEDIAEKPLKAKLAIAAGTAFLLASTTIATLTSANRAIPLLNIPVIPVGSNAVYIEENLGKYLLVAADAESGLVKIALPITSPHFSLSPFGDKALAEQNDLATLVDINGLKISKLSDVKEIDLPLFAPDGFKILAGKRNPEFADYFTDIVRIVSKTKPVVPQALNANAEFFSWSPDSRHFLYLSPVQGNGIEYAVTIVDTGTAKKQEINLAWTAKTPDLAEWSPDSGKIAISDGMTIYLAEYSQKEGRQIYDNKSGGITQIGWQSKNKLIFVENNEIKSINPETLESKVLAQGTDIALSQNRQLLGFLSKGDVFLYDFAKSAYRNITLSPQEETSFSFLPGGKSLIFVNESNGIQNVSVTGIDGGGYRQLTENSDPLVKYLIK